MPNQMQVEYNIKHYIILTVIFIILQVGVR